MLRVIGPCMEDATRKYEDGVGGEASADAGAPLGIVARDGARRLHAAKVAFVVPASPVT